MPGIYWRDEEGRLKAYSAATKGQKSALKVEIEVSDPRQLAWLLEQLAEIERAQKAARDRAADEARFLRLAGIDTKRVGKAGQPLPAPQLKLTDKRG